MPLFYKLRTMKEKRKTNRLAEYDYSQNGAYFITICTEGRASLLSIIIGDDDSLTVELTEYGKIAEEELLNLQQRYCNLKIENYVIMPNHIHILLCLENAGGAVFVTFLFTSSLLLLTYYLKTGVSFRTPPFGFI